MTAKQDSMAAGDAFADSDAIPWVLEGLIAGVIGSVVVALLFLSRDVANGLPLWTPSALAAALFRGEIAAESQQPELVLVAAYSVLHGAIFVGFGLAAAFLIETSRWLADHWMSTLAWSALALFAAFGVVFAVLVLGFAPGLLGAIGVGWVVAANALAALGMAWFLSLRAHARLET